MSELTHKDRLEMLNHDIAVMTDKLGRFNKRNYNNPLKDVNGGHVGDAYNIAEKLEDVLIAAGIVNEEERYYK